MTTLIETQTESDLERNGRHTQIIIFALTVLAFLVRLWGISQHSYWFDEAREVLRSLTNWPDVLFITEGADPPIYRLLLFPIAQLTTHEFWLRLPSALFSGAAVYLSYYWLKMLNLTKLAVLTALFMAISSVQIYYAQEVSQYSFTVFLALLLLIAFERVGRWGSIRNWLVFTFIIVVSLYSYYGLAWLLPILDLHLLWRIWQQRSRRQFFNFVGTHIFIGLSIMALYLTMLSTHMTRFSTNKQLEPFFINPGWWASIKQFDDLFLSGFVEFFIVPFSSVSGNWISLFFLLLIIGGSIYLCQRSLAACTLTVYFWGTVIILFLVRFIGIYPLGGRYGLAVLPLFFVLIAAAVAGLSRWPILAYSLGFVLVSSQVFFWPQFAGSINPWLALPRESLRPVVGYLNEQAQPGDIVYVYYGAGPAYQVYQMDSQLETVYGTWFRNLPLAEKVNEIQQAVGTDSRFWLAMSHIHELEDEDLLSGLAASDPGYVVTDSYREENAVVFLLEQVR